MGSRPITTFSPGKVILSSVCATIALGAVLLSFPACCIKPLPFLDLLFAATSATCVTGLFTVSLDQFTFFGQAILFVLIQIGGIGLITLSLLLISLFVNLGFSAQLMAGQLLELESWKNLKRMLVRIFVITLGTELIGACCIAPFLDTAALPGPSWFYALFHSVSAFCNAGIFPPGPSYTVASNAPLMLITLLLILIGGLGFVTWYEIEQWVVRRLRKKKFRFSLHSKIVLYGSFALLTMSAIIFWILEREHALASLDGIMVPLTCLFHALSFKGGGFTTIPATALQLPTLFLAMILTIIGAAPGSTGSGIKITTAIIFAATVKAALTGATSVSLRGRQIPVDQMFKTVGIVSMTVGWIILATFCLLITEPNASFFAVLFEVVSALTNLGLTTGITPALSNIGKCFIMVSMVVGRIGSFTLILALLRKRKEATGFTYPEERVMLG